MPRCSQTRAKTVPSPAWLALSRCAPVAGADRPLLAPGPAVVGKPGGQRATAHFPVIPRGITQSRPPTQWAACRCRRIRHPSWPSPARRIGHIVAKQDATCPVIRHPLDGFTEAQDFNRCFRRAMVDLAPNLPIVSTHRPGGEKEATVARGSRHVLCRTQGQPERPRSPSRHGPQLAIDCSQQILARERCGGRRRADR